MIQPIPHPVPASKGTIKDVSIRLAGRAQDGVQTVGTFLALLAGRSHRDVMTYMTIPATIGAGESVFQLRIGCEKVLTVGDQVDVLVAFYQDSYESHRSWLREGGILLYDTAEVQPAEDDTTTIKAGLAFGQLAAEATHGGGRGKNLFVLGLLARLFHLDDEALRALIRQRLGKKDSTILDRALHAFESGRSHECEGLAGMDRPLAVGANTAKSVVLDGNQALAYGLIAGGVRYGAGYPITPATSIMEVLRVELPKFGGSFLQTEDELAAACAAIGMSYGGHLAVTSTSGPGLSLKLEAMGYATMAEIPLIVINVQRGGPSTGIPTQVEQSDLLQAIWGSHGDAPRPVLAASGVEDCFHVAVEAARIAREYSTPVVILSDQILSTRIEAIPMPDLDQCMDDPKPDLSPRPGDFKPYAFGSITKHAPPGSRIEGGPYPTVTGLEHDESGKPSAGPAMHKRMTAKRREKLLKLRDTLPAPELFGEESGSLLLVSWGSSYGPVREAVLRLRDEGLKVSHLQLRHIHPLPPALYNILAGFEDVFTVEMNDSGLYGYGQLAYHLRAACGCPHIASFTKTEGLAFKVSEVMESVRAHLAETSTPTP